MSVSNVGTDSFCRRLMLSSSEPDYHRINFMASAGLLIAGADNEITQQELERIMSNISRMIRIPQGFRGYLYV